jgi:hypothetical protein
VRFDPTKKTFSARDYNYPDNHMGSVLVEKMTQKFAKNQFVPANDQISKMVIDLKKNIVYVYFHMNEGEISPKVKVIDNSFIIRNTLEKTCLGSQSSMRQAERRKWTTPW